MPFFPMFFSQILNGAGPFTVDLGSLGAGKM